MKSHRQILTDALMQVANEGYKLAEATNYNQGSDIVKFCSDTMGKVNELCEKNDKKP